MSAYDYDYESQQATQAGGGSLWMDEWDHDDLRNLHDQRVTFNGEVFDEDEFDEKYGMSDEE